MTIVTIQIGQCGNQVGLDFFSTLSRVYSDCEQNRYRLTPDPEFCIDLKERFFKNKLCDGLLTARALLVDTEPKVVQEVNLAARRTGIWQYNAERNYIQQQGAANNWMYGYSRHGTAAKDSIMELLRKEVEECDWLSGFIFMMSIAGGTGSGLGTFLTEGLREEYPKSCIVNQVVWPFSTGEVTVQGYNAVLSLSHLMNATDAMLLFENDHLQRVCMHRMGIKDVSLHHLNNVVSQQIIGLLLPCRSPFGFTPDIGDLLTHLVPHPKFKLIGLRSVPQEPAAALPYSTYNWQSLLCTLRRMTLFGSFVDEVSLTGCSRSSHYEPPCCLANLLVMRGPDSDTADPLILHKPNLPYASWVPSYSRLQVWNHSYSILGHDKMAVLASNGQFILGALEKGICKAWKMFSSKAYLHQYMRYGLTQEDFVHSFASLEQIIADYAHLKAE